MATKFTLQDVFQKNGQNFVRVSVSDGVITINREFAVNDTLNKVTIKASLQAELDQQTRVNNQLDLLKTKIGQDF